MAKKKTAGEVQNAAEAVVATPVTASEREKLLAKVTEMVAKYNESAEFAEHKVMKKLDEKIAEALSEYTLLAETECFNELKREPNPMVAAAMRLSFQTIRTPDRRQEDGSTIRVIEYADKYIDPLRLYKRINNGETPMWSFMIERLNMLMTAAAAKHLKLNEHEVRSTAALSDKAKAIALAVEEELDESSQSQNVQAIVDAMLGPGYQVLDTSSGFMQETHTRGGRASNAISCANVRSTRQRMLAVCKSAITQDSCWMLEYKKAKVR